MPTISVNHSPSGGTPTNSGGEAAEIHRLIAERTELRRAHLPKLHRLKAEAAAQRAELIRSFEPSLSWRLTAPPVRPKPHRCRNRPRWPLQSVFAARLDAFLSGNGVLRPTTGLIAEQLGWQSGRDLMVADDAEGFAVAYIRLSRDAALWDGVRSSALVRCAEDCDLAAFCATVSVLVESLQARRAKRWALHMARG